jgi:hypothetical protein
MARPLTKHDQNGKRYVRPAPIEAAIDIALTQDLPTVGRRAALRDHKAPDFVPSECLVHLVREARRREDDDTINALLPLLFERCMANLIAKLPEAAIPNAHDVREEVVGQLGELFAVDGMGQNPDELDYYEIRFNSAFRTLRLDVLRSEKARTRHSLDLPDPRADAEPTADDELFSRLSETFRSPATQEDALLLRDVARAIDGLPEDQRKAVVLCLVLGFEAESTDPASTTAATISGVTGRTIRNRLARAATILSRFKEDRP